MAGMRLPVGFLRRLFSRENLWALLLCLLILALAVLTADSAPLWIYQGF
jgi:hypothetical protein